MKFKSYILQAMLVGACAGTVCSCEDMLNMDSDYVIYSDEDHLNTPADTANSLLGIIYRLQAIGDRTNLLGEVRGDLVTLRNAAHADLHECRARSRNRCCSRREGKRPAQKCRCENGSGASRKTGGPPLNKRIRVVFSFLPHPESFRMRFLFFRG